MGAGGRPRRRGGAAGSAAVGGDGGPMEGKGRWVRVWAAGRGMVCGGEEERGRSGVPARGEEWVSGGILPMTGGPARN